LEGIEVAKKKRNYKKEYRDFHGKPEEIRRRSMRNKARRKMGSPKGMEVDHIRPLSRGGTNSKGNLRIVTRKANRSRKRG